MMDNTEIFRNTRLAGVNNDKKYVCLECGSIKWGIGTFYPESKNITKLFGIFPCDPSRTVFVTKKFGCESFVVRKCIKCNTMFRFPPDAHFSY